MKCHTAAEPRNLLKPFKTSNLNPNALCCPRKEHELTNIYPSNVQQPPNSIPLEFSILICKQKSVIKRIRSRTQSSCSVDDRRADDHRDLSLQEFNRREK
jgi:hypothetical protein